MTHIGDVCTDALGDRQLRPRTHSAPESENTSLRITGLNSTVTYNALRQGIRQIKHTRINEPDDGEKPPPQRHWGDADVLLRDTAEKLFEQTTRGEFLVQEIPPS